MAVLLVLGLLWLLLVIELLIVVMVVVVVLVVTVVANYPSHQMEQRWRGRHLFERSEFLCMYNCR